MNVKALALVATAFPAVAQDAGGMVGDPAAGG